MPRRPLALVALVLAALVGLALPAAVTAQTDGEPIPSDDCAVDPLDTDEAIDRLLAPLEVPEEGPAGLPLYVEDEDDLPTGDDVTSRTQREVEALVEQYVACTNAGQVLRIMALFTVDGLPFSIRAALGPLTESDLLTERQKADFLTQTLEVALAQPEAVALPQALWTTLVEVDDAFELDEDDDLIGARVVLDSPIDPRPEEPTLLLFAEEDGDLLIAGQVLVF